MRPLTYRQAARCEDATGSRCRCRCGGLAHGARRQGSPVEVVDPLNGDPTDNRLANLELKDMPQATQRAFLESLPEDDPHHVPAKKERP